MRFRKRVNRKTLQSAGPQSGGSAAATPHLGWRTWTPPDTWHRFSGRQKRNSKSQSVYILVYASTYFIAFLRMRFRKRVNRKTLQSAGPQSGGSAAATPHLGWRTWTPPDTWHRFSG